MCKDNNIISYKEYIEYIKTNYHYSRKIEINICTAEIFELNFIILEYINDYNGYIQRLKINIHDQLKQIAIFEYWDYNKKGNFNIVNLKNIEILENYIKDIPLIINNKYNYRILNKINVITNIDKNKNTIYIIITII